MNPGNSKIPGANVLQQLLEVGMTTADIAARYGVRKNTIRDRLALYGLSHLAFNKTPVQSQLDRDAIAADLRAGLNMAKIDRKYGVSPGTVKRFALTHDLLGLAPDAIEIHEDKIVIGRRFFGGKDGSARFMSISLPRNSLHVAVLQERM